MSVKNDFARIQQGLESSDPAQQRIAERGLAWVAQLLRKNSDYGSTVFEAPALCPTLDPGAALMVRMSDKIGRIRSLAVKDFGEVDESLTDSVEDLGAYCLLWTCRPDAADPPVGSSLPQVFKFPSSDIVYDVVEPENDGGPTASDLGVVCKTCGDAHSLSECGRYCYNCGAGSNR